MRCGSAAHRAKACKRRLPGEAALAEAQLAKAQLAKPQLAKPPKPQLAKEQPRKAQLAKVQLAKAQLAKERSVDKAEKWACELLRFQPPSEDPALAGYVALSAYLELRFSLRTTRIGKTIRGLAQRWGWQLGEQYVRTARAGSGRPYVCRRLDLYTAHCEEFGLRDFPDA